MAMVITSSSVSKRKTGATGPKVSSFASCMSVVAPVNTIGATRLLQFRLVGDDRCTLGERVLDVAVDLGDGGLVDHRADRKVFVRAGADLHRINPWRALFGETPVDAGLYQDPVGARTALPATAELRDDRAFDGKIKIGIVEHDERRVAVEFQRQAFDAVGGAAHQE